LHVDDLGRNFAMNPRNVRFWWHKQNKHVDLTVRPLKPGDQGWRYVRLKQKLSSSNTTNPRSAFYLTDDGQDDRELYFLAYYLNKIAMLDDVTSISHEVRR